MIDGAEREAERRAKRVEVIGPLGIYRSVLPYV
jgi:hypothetical protein